MDLTLVHYFKKRLKFLKKLFLQYFKATFFELKWGS